ncbi:MAG: metalloregulator ArsR/SmtB family transcription factor [candidate division Zixibacteria bacterium]|nr:metalloregulator ArsR/SmtB family transcription factor [candidate division Zixibacteria bacterium]
MMTKELTQQDYKDLLYRQFALVGKAVSSNRRLELLDLLCQGERTVEDLARETGASISSVSQHLQVLKTAKLVNSRKEGLYVYHFLADESVGEFWRALRALAFSRSAELREMVQSIVEGRDDLEQVSHEELMERARRGEVIVLDVRPEVEYQSGHIADAVSIPIDRLEAHLKELPKDREVVAYCRGPYCLFSLEAVDLLRSHGYKARRLIDGYPEWEAGGRPVQRGENSKPHRSEQSSDHHRS